jgi:TPR repeat protein
MNIHLREVHMAPEAHLEDGPVDLRDVSADPNQLFDLGIRYSADGSVRADYVIAHACFNLAALKGHSEAVERRLEIAVEMSTIEIAAAQRAARSWLAKH